MNAPLAWLVADHSYQAPPPSPRHRIRLEQRPYNCHMADSNANTTGAGLPQWRLSDALGAAIASRTAGSPVSFGSEELTAWIRIGECPSEETHFAVAQLLRSMLADEARLLLIDERVDWDDLARFVLHCEVQDSCALSPFLWTAFPDWGFPEPGESRTRDKLALAGWPEHECY